MPFKLIFTYLKIDNYTEGVAEEFILNNIL